MLPPESQEKPEVLLDKLCKQTTYRISVLLFGGMDI